VGTLYAFYRNIFYLFTSPGWPAFLSFHRLVLILQNCYYTGFHDEAKTKNTFYLYP